MARENQTGFRKTGRGHSMGVIEPPAEQPSQDARQRQAELERERELRELRERQGG